MERKHEEEGSASWAKYSASTEAWGLKWMCKKKTCSPRTEKTPSAAGTGNLLLLCILLNFCCRSFVSFF